jgi:hypothetical protein
MGYLLLPVGLIPSYIIVLGNIVHTRSYRREKFKLCLKEEWEGKITKSEIQPIKRKKEGKDILYSSVTAWHVEWMFETICLISA